MQANGWGTTADGSAWARTIIDVYMLWFTFLVSSNIVAACWTFGKAVESSLRMAMMAPVCWAIIVTDLLTAAMTFVVAATLKPWAPPGFEAVINGAGIANAIVVIVFAVVWFLGWARLRHLAHGPAGSKAKPR